MPAIADISINDAKTTPVAHVFGPVTTNGSRAELANRAASIISGFELLNIEVRKPASPTGAYRMIGKLTLPTVGAVSGADAVIRTSSASFEINFAQASTVQDRKDAVKLLSNLFNHATVVTMAEKVEPLY
jgi:hypothetical protein